MTGIERDQGEKWGPYLGRVSPLYLTGKLESERTALGKKQVELEEKIKNGSTDEALKTEHEALKGKFSTLQEKEAEFDRVKEGNFETKYTDLFKSNNQDKEDAGILAAKPAFPDTVNAYESDAKWKDFVKEVREKYDIKIDEDKTAWAVDKENEFKKTKLSEVAEKNEKINTLLQGRKQVGAGSDPNVKLIDIKDVPFKVPENATPTQRQKAIKDYLLNDQKLGIMSPEYTKKFAELNTLLLNPQKTA